MTTAIETQKLNITLVGCGKMGSALLRGWLSADVANEVYVIKPSPLKEEFNSCSNVVHFNSVEAFKNSGKTSDVVVLAVKPQIMEGVCQELKSSAAVDKDELVVSVATGQTIASFEQRFGNNQPIVRTMPNTPSAVGRGMTVAVANDNVDQKQKDMTQRLFEASGDLIWTNDESSINTVAAISGSGPAYFFLFTEMLAQAGVKAGLSEETAMLLARKTFEGSAALAERDAHTPVSTLRDNVTSPGGSTAEAVRTFTDSGTLQSIFDDAIAAAIAKNKALAAPVNNTTTSPNSSLKL